MLSKQVNGFFYLNGTLRPVEIIKEAFDLEVELSRREDFDIIVDGIWWMFSISYARCYTAFLPHVDVIKMYFLRFRDEIIKSFGTRW